MSQLVTFKFRLYVAYGVANSSQAIANLNALCRAHLPDRHVIEIIDVFRESKRALQDRIIMTPTLIKLSPAPVQRIVGTLSQREIVLQALGLWNHESAKITSSMRSPPAQ
jgi:circadian clock protein KaiB